MDIKNLTKYRLPDTPGVYFWKEKGRILYIGKATSLHDRVRSYFSSDLISTRGPRIVDMVFKSDSIEWLETDSILEALIAEANLIKEHWPDYNVKEKDDKSWNYVVVTRDKFPLILTIRGRTLDVEKRKKEFKIRATFGPFTNGSALREALKIIRKMFPFIDRHSSTKYTSGFYRQIGLSPDTTNKNPKNRNCAERLYKKNVDHIILFFSGKKQKLVRMLEKEMNEYARNLEFEKADLIKRKIFALNHIRDVALIKENVETSDLGFRIEAYDIAHTSGRESVGVMTVVIDGEISKSEYRKFKISKEIGNNDTASLREIIERRLNHNEWQWPNLIVIDGGRGQLNVAEKVLKERGVTVPVVSVVKDEHHKPINILGNPELVVVHKKAILLANNESHRFAITYHRKLRRIKND